MQVICPEMADVGSYYVGIPVPTFVVTTCLQG